MKKKYSYIKIPKGFANAILVYKTAKDSVPAYRDLLSSLDVPPDNIQNYYQFRDLPVLDKQNYISRYPLPSLCIDGELHASTYIVSSSGSTGLPFDWPRSSRQDRISNMQYKQIFENIFIIGQSPTLVINTYAQGSWIAGTEFNSAIKQLAKGSPYTIVNPGIAMGQAVRYLKNLNIYFKKIVLVGYPPFIRDMLDVAKAEGVKLKKLDIYIIVGGESISEPWREYTLNLIDRKAERHRIVCVYGMSDGGGVIAIETPLTIAIRKSMHQENTKLGDIFGKNFSTCLYQYNPHTHFFETDTRGQLLLTTMAGTPLVRYNTKDSGDIVEYKELLKIPNLPNEIQKYLGCCKLPFVFLKGRKEFSVSFYGANLFSEHFRTILHENQQSNKLSGRFVLSVKEHAKYRQQIHLDLELSLGDKGDVDIGELGSYISARLCFYNIEYAELFNKLGEQKCTVQIKLHKFGTIIKDRGTKQKWVRLT
jgi:phenylacetate-CoA ligase